MYEVRTPTFSCQPSLLFCFPSWFKCRFKSLARVWLCCLRTLFLFVPLFLSFLRRQKQFHIKSLLSFRKYTPSMTHNFPLDKNRDGCWAIISSLHARHATSVTSVLSLDSPRKHQEILTPILAFFPPELLPHFASFFFLFSCLVVASRSVRINLNKSVRAFLFQAELHPPLGSGG